MLDLKTVSSEYSHILGWTPALESISSAERGFEVNRRTPLKACGCGVKIDLDEIVYPTLNNLKAWFPDTLIESVGRRVDSFAMAGSFDFLERLQFDPPMKWETFESQAERVLRERNPDLVVELFSSPFNFYREFDQLYYHYSSRQKEKYRHFLRAIEQSTKGRDASRLQFGKGHSIQGEKDFFVLDFIGVRPNPKEFLICNNDTIITGDSVLKTSCAINIFIAFNNALNDILLGAATARIQVYPVYDGAPEDIENFKSAFQLYESFVRTRGIDLTVVDRGPLNVGAHLIGATVVGHSDRSPPHIGGMFEGQDLILTHLLGDLCLLSVHREKFVEGNVDPELSRTRNEIIQKMATPHFLLAQILAEFLPAAGEGFRPERHVTFASDVSGPGLSVLDDAVAQGGVDIFIDALNFHDELLINHPRKNYTSSTNGPWLLSAAPEVARRLLGRLRGCGFNESHKIGRVLNKSSSPKVFVDQKILDYYSLDRFSNDIFNPRVSVQTQLGPLSIHSPLFRRIGNK